MMGLESKINIEPRIYLRVPRKVGPQASESHQQKPSSRLGVIVPGIFHLSRHRISKLGEWGESERRLLLVQRRS